MYDSRMSLESKAGDRLIYETIMRNRKDRKHLNYAILYKYKISSYIDTEYLTLKCNLTHIITNL